MNKQQEEVAEVEECKPLAREWRYVLVGNEARLDTKELQIQREKLGIQISWVHKGKVGAEEEIAALYDTLQ